MVQWIIRQAFWGSGEFRTEKKAVILLVTISPDHRTGSCKKHETLFALIIGVATTASAIQVVSIPSDPAEFHIYLAIGQSNMAGSIHPEAQDTTPIPRTTKVMAGDLPLQWIRMTDHLSVGGCCMTPYITFSKTMVLRDQSIMVGVVHAAQGGSRMYQWVRGGEYYDRMMTVIQWIGTKGTFKGVVFHQG